VLFYRICRDLWSQGFLILWFVGICGFSGNLNLLIGDEHLEYINKGLAPPKEVVAPLWKVFQPLVLTLSTRRLGGRGSQVKVLQHPASTLSLGVEG
jgi:hypothetical protein